MNVNVISFEYVDVSTLFLRIKNAMQEASSLAID